MSDRRTPPGPHVGTLAGPGLVRQDDDHIESRRWPDRVRGACFGADAPSLSEDPLSPSPATGLLVSTPSGPRRSQAWCLSPPGPPPWRDSASSLRVWGTVPVQLQAQGVERTWSREGLNGDRQHSTSSRQQQTYRRSTAWPQQAPRATAVSPPAAGSDTERRSAARPAPRSSDASRTSDQDGPEPGHLTRRRARSERRPEERSDGERTGPQRRRGPRRSAREPLNRMAEGESRRRPEYAMRAARKEVSTGTI